ncbi:LIC11612 family fibronectin-binding protein [Leptospira barantonii]|uniref:Uncharacterized protein n=1 Tax=Leptospira barantonii TaxID=2023184 RepID=A0ABX4NKG5_9LEPT|nr:hypothetical protein [Leptospira barantonii]PJZ56142.1 hypothetical protein CH367_17775 [Leptospira barantonii]
MFRFTRKQTFTILLILSTFCFQNVFSETGGLRDRPVSVVLVCEPSSKADKPRFYKSTSLFFKRLKNKRVQENGTAFLVGYGSFASELPSEQLNLAGQNGYDLYIFPQTALENLPSSQTANGVPWISFVVEKKEITKPQTQKKSSKKGKSSKSSSQGKKRKNKSKSDSTLNRLNPQPEPGVAVGQTSETNSPDKIELKQPASEKSETKKTAKSKKSKKQNSSKTKSARKTKPTTAETDPKVKQSSTEKNSSENVNQPTKSETTKTNTTSIGSASFELSFDTLKFWFSTITNPIELSWTQERILFLAGDKTAEEWNQILSGKTEDTTAIRLLNSPQDLKFNEGIYYTGCASPGIPNGVSVLNFFFRGNRLIRLKQESFSLNSDGSGKSWELE